LGWTTWQERNSKSEQPIDRDGRGELVAPDDDGLRPEPPPPGSFVEVVLAGEPATHYLGSLPVSGADEEYRAAVATLGRKDVVYDQHLSRAATEYAIQSSRIGTSPPEAAMTFLLQSAGAPDATAGQLYVSTESEEPAVIARSVQSALSGPIPGDGPIFVGVGEASNQDAMLHRRVIVLFARRPYEIDSAPRSAPVDNTWTVRGRLPSGFREPSLLVMYPSGTIDKLELTTNGDRFEAQIPTGATPGTMHVGIDGIGRGGPGKLLQLTVEIGQPPPRQFTARIPSAEGPFETIDDAEAFALSLLRDDRQAHGLQRLEWDPALAAIARSHSEEMRAQRYFGHLSPNTGLAADRLVAAGYRAAGISENLAKNDALVEAEASLMESVGHRSNMLSKIWKQVGIGVAADTSEEGRTSWYVTQLFAKRVDPIAPDEGAARVFELVNREVRKNGHPPLARDRELDRIARGGAAQAATAASEQLAQSIGEKARRVVDRSAAVSVQVIYHLDDVRVPEEAGEFSRVGIGWQQSEDDPRGVTGLVIVLGR
jgi:uncharacterized protein YkwD